MIRHRFRALGLDKTSQIIPVDALYLHDPPPQKRWSRDPSNRRGEACEAARPKHSDLSQRLISCQPWTKLLHQSAADHGTPALGISV